MFPRFHSVLVNFSRFFPRFQSALVNFSQFQSVLVNFCQFLPGHTRQKRRNFLTDRKVGQNNTQQLRHHHPPHHLQAHEAKDLNYDL